MNKRHLYALAFSLIVIGLGIFLYKVLVLEFPLAPDKTADSWDIELRAAFTAHNGPVKLELFLPRPSTRYALIDESFISPGYGFTAKELAGNRQITWSIRRAKGRQVLYYRAIVHRLPGSGIPAVAAGTEPAPIPYEGAKLAAANALIADIRAHSADVPTFVAELLKRLQHPERNENLQVLLAREDSPLRRMQVAVEVLGQAGMAARVVHGVRLHELQRDVPLMYWLELAEKDRWRPYDPATAAPGIPEDYLPWWRGDVALAAVKGGRELNVRVSTRLVKEAALSNAVLRGQIAAPGLLDYSLLSLPIETQTVYHVLLLVPLGAFLLVVLRNIVGVKTFGTFMPVLIALAFRETQLLWGVLLFSLVVGLGLVVRFYLDRLKLLLVPRLASVLTVVVLLMAGISVVSFKLGIERGLSVALFPMVIMTMTIERMSIVWEERGPGEALQQGLGSLIVAALAYLVMSVEYVRHLVFVFPELLLVVLAAMLLLGRYSGYRLTELVRFRVLTKD